jgi:hypothetical protein
LLDNSGLGAFRRPVLAFDPRERRGVEQQRLRQRVGPIVGDVAGRLAQQRGVIVGEPAERDDRAPSLFPPQFALGGVGGLGG